MGVIANDMGPADGKPNSAIIGLNLFSATGLIRHGYSTVSYQGRQLALHLGVIVG